MIEKNGESKTPGLALSKNQLERVLVLAVSRDEGPAWFPFGFLPNEKIRRTKKLARNFADRHSLTDLYLKQLPKEVLRFFSGQGGHPAKREKRRPISHAGASKKLHLDRQLLFFVPWTLPPKPGTVTEKSSNLAIQARTPKIAEVRKESPSKGSP